MLTKYQLRGDQRDSTVEAKGGYMRKIRRVLKRVKFGYHLNREDVSVIKSALNCQYNLIEWEREIQKDKEIKACSEAEAQEEEENE